MLANMPAVGQNNVGNRKEGCAKEGNPQTKQRKLLVQQKYVTDSHGMATAIKVVVTLWSSIGYSKDL